MQIYRADLTVTVFSYDTFRLCLVAFILVVRFLTVVIRVAVKEENYVCVLLDRARITKILKCGTVRFTLCLGTAGKLCAGNNRNF